jgi:hypothetical protein
VPDSGTPMPVASASMPMPNYAFKPYFVKVLLLYELNVHCTVQCSELRNNMNKRLKQVTDIVIEEGTTTWLLMPETSTENAFPTCPPCS